MTRAALLALTLAGCVRLGFDPTAGADRGPMTTEAGTTDGIDRGLVDHGAIDANTDGRPRERGASDATKEHGEDLPGSGWDLFVPIDHGAYDGYAGVYAIISGHPVGISEALTISVKVGGANVVAYKVALRSGGGNDCATVSYRDEAPVGEPFRSTLDGFPDGEVVLCVVGRDATNSWQPATLATEARWIKQTVPHRVEFAQWGQQVVEADVALALPIKVTPALQRAATVDYVVLGTAAPSQHTLTSGSFTVPAGVGTLDVPFRIKDQAAITDDRTIVVYLTAVKGDSLARIGPAYRHEVNIRDRSKGKRPAVLSLSTRLRATCAIFAGHRHMCWGENASGQFGDGTTTPSAVPKTISLARYREVRHGGGSTGSRTHHVNWACGITVSGGIECWGENEDGQLGAGDRVDSLEPRQVVGAASGASKLALGFRHACALFTGGEVRCWGGARLGDGSTADSPTPVQAIASGATDIAVGEHHSCARMSSGEVRCWGTGEYVTPTAPRGFIADAPVVAIASGVDTVRAGQLATCVIRSTTKALECWGYRFNGLEQVIAAGVVDADLAGSGPVFSERASLCVLLSGGEVRCSGGSRGGVSGTPEPLAQTTVLRTVITGGAKGISTGYHTACAVLADDAIACWGDNRYGAAGRAANYAATPRSAGRTYSTVRMGAAGVVCGITAGGALHCWGNNGATSEAVASLFGTQSDVWQSGPIQLFAGGVQDVCAGSAHICAVVAGALRCWGPNASGNPGGFAYGGPARTPQTLIPKDVEAVSCGSYNTCAIVRGGELRCWGTGEIGAPRGASGEFVTVFPRDVVAVRSYGTTTCALLTGGRLYCWGQNSRGGVGDGTKNIRSTPFEVISGGVVDFDTGGSISCAVLDTGELKCWGDAQFVHPTHGPSPVTVVAAGADRVSVAGAHLCVVMKPTGDAQCWGLAVRGQTGGGGVPISVNRNSRVTALSSVRSIHAAAASTCALTRSDELTCWGDNTGGQLGDRTAIVWPSVIGGLD